MGLASCDLSSVLYNLPVWKTITVGESIRPDLPHDSPCIGPWCRDVLERVVPSPSPLQLDLIIASPAHFGFEMGGSYRELHEMSRTFDFELCPADASLELLREDYRGQPDGLLHIISESIPDSDGEECIFVISLEGGKTVLRVTRADPERVLSASSKMILVRNKRVLNSRSTVH